MLNQVKLAWSHRLGSQRGTRSGRTLSSRFSEAAFFMGKGGRVIDVRNIVSMPDAANLPNRSLHTLRTWAKAGRVKAQNIPGHLWPCDRDDLLRAAERKEKISA